MEWRRLPINWKQIAPLAPVLNGNATNDDGNLLIDVLHFGTELPRILDELAYSSLDHLFIRRVPEFHSSCINLPKHLSLANLKYQRLAMYILSRPELRIVLCVLLPVHNVYNMLSVCYRYARCSACSPNVCALMLRSLALCCNEWSEARNYIQKALSLSKNNAYLKNLDIMIEHPGCSGVLENCEYPLSEEFTPKDGDDGVVIVDELIMIALLHAAYGTKRYMKCSELTTPLLNTYEEGLNILKEGKKCAVQWFGSKHPLVYLCEAARYQFGKNKSWFQMWIDSHSRAAKKFKAQYSY